MVQSSDVSKFPAKATSESDFDRGEVACGHIGFNNNLSGKRGWTGRGASIKLTAETPADPERRADRVLGG
jgi:hypothetical protein